MMKTKFSDAIRMGYEPKDGSVIGWVVDKNGKAKSGKRTVHYKPGLTDAQWADEYIIVLHEFMEIFEIKHRHEVMKNEVK